MIIPKISIDDVLIGASGKLLKDAGWEKVTRGTEKHLWAKDGHEVQVTPAVAYALWDVYGIDDR